MKSKRLMTIILAAVVVIILCALAWIFRSAKLYNKGTDDLEIISVYYRGRDVTGEISPDDVFEVLADMRIKNSFDVYAPYLQENVMWEINFRMNNKRWYVICGDESLNFANDSSTYYKLLNWEDISDYLNSSIAAS